MRSCIRSTLLAATMLAAPVGMVLAPLVATPVHAWRVVYDPRNHAENLLTAARSLEQINNQIAQLQNEAQMLTNQARDLASLPFSALSELQASVQETQALLSEAQRLAYDVADIERAFDAQYGTAAGAGDADVMVGNARERWQTSVASFEDALKVQAGVVGNVETYRSKSEALVTRSQDAVGALQAAQAGNQLLALQSAQLADLTAAIAAANRADALEAARAASAEEQARENLHRFLHYGTGYARTRVRMFGG
jgi:P-type conjugative transfer protein TrbJ